MHKNALKSSILSYKRKRRATASEETDTDEGDTTDRMQRSVEGSRPSEALPLQEQRGNSIQNQPLSSRDTAVSSEGRSISNSIPPSEEDATRQRRAVSPEAYDPKVFYGPPTVEEDPEPRAADYVPVAQRFDSETRARREDVREGFLHVWTNYKKYAWGADELKTVSGRPSGNEWGNMGATICDSMDTLWILGLYDDFKESMQWVRDHFNPAVDWNGSVFEVTIRYIGSFLAAYEISHDKMFLDKAEQTARQLLPGFNTPSGLAYTTVNMKTGHAFNPSWNGRQAVLSEFGSLGLEWRHLTHLTGNPLYRDTVDKIFCLLSNYSADHNMGLLPTYWNQRSGTSTNSHITYGARGDSYYEYLIKQWVQSAKRDKRSRELYDMAIRETFERHWKKSTPSGYAWICEYNNNVVVEKMDELVCFFSGMLTLDEDPSHLPYAEALSETCFHIFNDSATGLGPEIAGFHEQQSRDFTFQAAHNLLRPETVESMFYLWRKTHRKIYRERAWAIWQAWQRHARTQYGYSGIKNVDRIPVTYDGRMESFFLAETLKYLYLIFSEDEVFDFSTWVFNTEAHPLRIHR